MKSARAFESWRVLVCGAAMLSQVLRPRFIHKVLDVPAGLGDIREQAPEYRSVTIPDRLRAANKIGGDQMGDFWCTFPLKAIDGYL